MSYEVQHFVWQFKSSSQSSGEVALLAVHFSMHVLVISVFSCSIHRWIIVSIFSSVHCDVQIFISGQSLQQSAHTGGKCPSIQAVDPLSSVSHQFLQARESSMQMGSQISLTGL
eukprot:173051_1